MSDNLKENEKPDADAETDLDKFKQVSFELLDIGLHYTNKGVDKVKSFPLYQKVDSTINL